MQRRFDLHTNPQYGWSTTSPEYYEHLTRMQRTPSIIYPDVPSTLHDRKALPNVSPTSHQKVIHEQVPVENKHHENRHQIQKQVVQKKVHFTEQQKTTEVVKDGKAEVVSVEKDVNKEADGFIQRKHKNFDMLKWGTFKVS